MVVVVVVREGGGGRRDPGLYLYESIRWIVSIYMMIGLLTFKIYHDANLDLNPID